jgi:hypothetical protein
MRSIELFRPVTLALGLALSACGSSNLTLPSDGTPAKLLRISGDGQKASAGEQLPAPLVVRLSDANSRPVANVAVVFRFQSSIPQAQVDPSNATTDSLGLAQVRVRLGSTAGTQEVEARVSEGVNSDLVATFGLTALEVQPPDPGGGSGGGGGGGDGGGGHDDGGGNDDGGNGNGHGGGHGNGGGHGHGHDDDD